MSTAKDGLHGPLLPLIIVMAKKWLTEAEKGVTCRQGMKHALLIVMSAQCEAQWTIFME